MKGETYIKKLSLNKEISLLKEQNKINEKIVCDFKNLVKECNQDIENLNKNESFNKELKEQTLSVLSNITLKMEMIMDIK